MTQPVEPTTTAPHSRHPKRVAPPCFAVPPTSRRHSRDPSNIRIPHNQKSQKLFEIRVADTQSQPQKHAQKHSHHITHRMPPHDLIVHVQATRGMASMRAFHVQSQLHL
ncbi:hypothetical protein M758_8G050200 [Ceratodon purpureus]|nr:hypothetical protein M758_8G050200 [Ceratodon purpureus]